MNNATFEIGDLANPDYNFKNSKISNFKPESLIDLLTTLIKIRTVENKLAKLKKEKLIGGPVHLGVGQEAISVGIAKNLSKEDIIYGAHRSHAHILALGCDMKKFFAEILCKETGLSKGRGGSMHLIDRSVGFYGSVPIVAGTVPLAAGAALASKIRNQKNISVAFFGDGAIEEGIIHETLNFAKIYQLPIIFVCENNLFSSHMHISERQPFNSTLRYAYANGINNLRIDGNDVTEVVMKTKEIIKNIKGGSGPYFIEAITYRWYGHVDWREDIDVGISRSKEDLINWKKRDPIKRLVDSMLRETEFTLKDYSNIVEDQKELINLAIAEAIEDKKVDPKDIKSNVFKGMGS